MNPFVSIIIVTHNSQTFIPRCLEAIDCQTVLPCQIIVIDSGSDDTAYLNEISKRKDSIVRSFSNIGFAAANNRGLEHLHSRCDYLLFINPDTFLSESAIEKSLEIIEPLPDVAILTGLLEGYDSAHSCKTGKIDSSGIFRSWYGRWYDRGQGDPIEHKTHHSENIPAICGAFMFCRLGAVKSEFPALFDESFFMYKEDIELCVRLSAKGWKLHYSPQIKAFHCRGWKDNRRQISRNLKLMSAENEIKMYKRHPSIYMIWAQMKYFLVRYLNV